MSNSLPALPQSTAAVEWVVLGPDHGMELFDLLSAVEYKDHALFRTSQQEVDQMLGRPDTAIAVGAYAVDVAQRGRDQLEDREPGGGSPGQLVAFGYIGLARSGEKEAICHGGIHPDFRGLGLGEDVMRWQTTKGAELLNNAFPGERGRVVHTVDAGRPALHTHLESLGYSWQDSYAELRHDLARVPEVPTLPQFVEVLPWHDEWERPTRRAFKRAASALGENGSDGVDRWSAMRQDTEPQWSFIAVDRSGDRARVIGLLELACYEQDWSALGWKEGYIDAVAVFDLERRTRILEALVATAMAAIAKEGLDKIAVGLDPQREQDMMDFYLSLGFDPHVWWRTYSLQVESKDKTQSGDIAPVQGDQ